MQVKWSDAMDEVLEGKLAEASKVDDVARYFRFCHLPQGSLRDTSRLFAYLAYEVIERLPRCPQRTVALRKLLEGKDAAVRAALP